MEKRRYPTDLSDEEWRCISPHLPRPTVRGRPRLHGLRAVLNAVFYVLKSGCPWRLRPKGFPPWKTAYDWVRRWRIGGGGGRSGGPWRLRPKDFPPWKTVYDWFRRWRIDGTMGRGSA